MLGCFNPNLGQIWTNPNVGLKMLFKILTQIFTFNCKCFNYIFNPAFWVETTQHDSSYDFDEFGLPLFF